MKCDFGSTVVRVTHLVAGASSIAPEGGVRLPSEISVVHTTSVPSQVLNFGILAYITDCYGKLHLPKEAASWDDGLLASPSSQPPKSHSKIHPCRGALVCAIAIGASARRSDAHHNSGLSHQPPLGAPKGYHL
jgi:hypothetical protein